MSMVVREHFSVEQCDKAAMVRSTLSSADSTMERFAEQKGAEPTVDAVMQYHRTFSASRARLPGASRESRLPA